MWGCDVFGYVTGFEPWDSQCKNPKPQGWTAAWFFVLFCVLGNQILLNLFIGVIITSMELIRDQMIEERDINHRRELVKELYDFDDAVEKRMLEIYELLDCNENGRLTVSTCSVVAFMIIL